MHACAWKLHKESLCHHSPHSHSNHVYSGCHEMASKSSKYCMHSSQGVPNIPHPWLFLSMESHGVHGVSNIPHPWPIPNGSHQIYVACFIAFLLLMQSMCMLCSCNIHKQWVRSTSTSACNCLQQWYRGFTTDHRTDFCWSSFGWHGGHIHFFVGCQRGNFKWRCLIGGA